MALDTASAALISATLATTGWVYTSRASRVLSRKQHTINVMLQTIFNDDFHNSYQRLMTLLRAGAISIVASGSEREAFRLVANYFEFVSAGIRHGDFDEHLAKDCMYGQITSFYSHSDEFIQTVRDDKRHQTLYEHIEWLYKRWKVKRPNVAQRAIEWFLIRPIYGRRKRNEDGQRCAFSAKPN